MKILYLMRHGQAETKAAHPDVKRELDTTGRNEVKEMAEKLLKAEIKPGLILSSHAYRARQTAEIVAETMAYPIKNILIEEAVYHTTDEELLEVVQQQEDKFQHILLAGHNPSISRLAMQLHPQIRESMPTAAIVAIRSESNSWAHFGDHQASLLFFSWPGSGPLPEIGGNKPEKPAEY